MTRDDKPRSSRSRVDKLAERLRKRDEAARDAYVDLGADISIPRAVEWHWQFQTLYLGGKAVFEGGRYVVDTLSLWRMKGAPPVDTEALRTVPVANMFRDSMQATFEAFLTAFDPWRVGQGLPPIAEALREGQTDENLALVAGIYRLAYAYGYSPTKAVAEKFGVSRATAGRWIAAARKHQFLGPATGTKAGEVPRKGSDSGTR